MFVDYAPKGVKFFYLYKALAHPGLHGYVAPLTLEERLMHIGEARRTLGSNIPWLCDSMANDLKHALGDSPNSEFVLDPEGRIAGMREWSRPDALRADLERLVGGVEKPTSIASLGIREQPAPRHAPTGVVPRLELDGIYRPLKIEAQLQKSKFPFYVKLRAEAEPGLLRAGSGKLYLGFFPDPLYGVHWNNQVAPVRYEFHAPPEVEITPSQGQGPKIEEEADADPREFLLQVERRGSSEPARMIFHYYACTDEWCRAVTQEYLIHWQADPDGGRAPGRGGPPMDRLRQLDRNRDGRISQEEAPEPLRRRFRRLDTNGDGFLDRQELEAMRARGRRR